MTDNNKDIKISILERYFLLALPGTNIAEVLTLPFETSRTLLMAVGPNKNYNDIFSCIRYIKKT